MKRPPDEFVRSIRHIGDRFSRADVQAAFPDLAPSTLSVYLSQAVQSGLLERIGTREYAVPVAQEIGSVLPQHAEKVVGRLGEVLPPSAMQQVLVWSNEDFSKYSHDAIMEPFVVVEARKPLAEKIRDALDHSFWVVPAKSRMDLGARIDNADWKWGAPEHVFVLGAATQAAIPSTRGFMVPRPGHLLATLVYMPEWMDDIAPMILEQDERTLRDAVGALGSRKGAIWFGAYLERFRLRYHDHPAVPAIEALLGDSRW